MLEETNMCAICEREVSRRVKGVPVYYCAECFERFKDDILNRVPWVIYLMNREKQRRKKRNRLLSAKLLQSVRYLKTEDSRYA